MAQVAENSKMQPRGKPFAKGVSGNPGGRPKRTQEEVDLIAACKEQTPEALEVIQDLMANSSNDRVRLAAAEYILDRAWGKPTQRQEIEPIQLEVFTTDRRPEEVYQEMLEAGRRLVQ
jgi:hypothetical protein